MGVFQASMLEAFQSLRDKFMSFKKTPKQPEVDQTSTSVSKPGLSNQAAILDPPPPRPPQTTSQPVEDMEVEYGPSLPPGLGADHQVSERIGSAFRSIR